jgi:ATP-binding cassette subfamily B protein RaxB
MKEWLDLLGTQRRVPVFQQTEAAECGLACIGMLANYHGHRMSLAHLRQTYAVSTKGVTLKDLIDLANALQLETRAVRLDMDALDQLTLPCVLHWDMAHFVVLVEVTGAHAVVHDPAVGRRRLSLAEFAKHFTGVAMEAEAKADFKPITRTRSVALRSLIGKVAGLKRGVVQVVVLGLALEVLAVTMPFQLQWVVDHAIPNADQSLLTVLGVGFLLLIAIRSFTLGVRGWLVVTLSQQLNFQWLGHVLSHMMRLPMAYFEKRHLGAILQNFHSVSHIQESLTRNFVQGVVDGFLVLGTLGMMLLYSPALTGLALLAITCYVALRLWFVSRLFNARAELLIYESRQETHLMETVRGAQAVRLYGRTNERRMGWLNMLADQFNANFTVQRIELLQQVGHDMLFGATRVALVWMGAVAATQNQFTVGMVFAFISYQDQFAERISGLVDKVFELKMLRLHMERVGDIVLTEPEPLRQDKLQRLPDGPLGIELRDVSFRYAANEADVLKRLNLRIEPGQCVAITGPSGCGKTTMAKVLLGLLKPTEGQILINGRPLHQVGVEQYRERVSTVMQDDNLFTGSIADNISFFDPQTDMAHVEDCARMAAIHDDIMQMAMGYQSLVGDTGTGLSGGQKQRVLLARALYRRPAVLVLDEATSHLDVTNELAVNEEIKRYPVTRIVIAHRPDTIAMADRVVFMGQGEVLPVLDAPTPRRAPRRRGLKGAAPST